MSTGSERVVGRKKTQKRALEPSSHSQMHLSALEPNTVPVPAPVPVPFDANAENGPGCHGASVPNAEVAPNAESGGWRARMGGYGEPE
jgi:hypothetical protein